MENKEVLKIIARVGVVAALYAVITIVSTPLSYGNIQFRLAEILVLLCFFNKYYILGVTLGCFISNIFSFSPWDMLVGTSATLFSSILIYFSPKLLISCLYPIVINGFLVGLELFLIQGLPFWLTVGQVILGEFSVIVVGYLLWFFLMKNEKIQTIFDVKKHQDFKW